MHFRWIFISLVLPSILLESAWSQDAKRAVINPFAENIVRHYIPKAVEIQFTKRFKAFEGKRLLTILQNQSTPIDLSEGHFAEQNWASEKAYKIEESNLPEESKKTFLEAKKFLEQAIIRPSVLNPIRPSLKVGDSGYEARFNRFALLSDSELMAKLNRPDGVVLVLEVEIRKIVASASYVTVWDADNSIIDPITLNGISIQMADAKTPLKMRLPFYIRTNEKSELEFEALEFDSNANLVKFEAKISEILWPKINIRGKTFELTDLVSQEYLNEQINAYMPTLNKQGPQMLMDLAKSELPNFLNTEFKQSVTGAFAELSTIDSIVVSEKDSTLRQRKPFFWELQLEAQGINQNFETKGFGISLKSAIEDDLLKPDAQAKSVLNPKSLAKTDTAGRTIPPNIGMFPADNFDLSISVNRGFINRLLQLSFMRGNFEKIAVPQKDGSQMILKAVEAPVVDFYRAGDKSADPKSTYLKVHAKIKLPPEANDGFLESLALKNEAELSADLIVNTREVEYKGNCDKDLEGNTAGVDPLHAKVQDNQKFIQLRIAGIDKDSIEIDSRWIRLGGRFTRNYIIDLIDKTISTPMKNEPTHLACLQPPFDLMGIKPELTALKFDPNGYIIFFMSVPDNNVVGVSL